MWDNILSICQPVREMKSEVEGTLQLRVRWLYIELSKHEYGELRKREVKNQGVNYLVLLSALTLLILASFFYSCWLRQYGECCTCLIVTVKEIKSL